jgi:AraC-like DNA-binding protein
LRQRQYIDESNGGLIRECRMFIPGLLTFRMGTRPAHLRRRNTSRHVSVQRLERAKELLIRGDQSLLDIAIALNFSSLANFTRALSQAHWHDS